MKSSLLRQIDPSKIKCPSLILFAIRFTVAVQVGAFLVTMGLFCFMTIVLSPVGVMCFATAGRFVSKSFTKDQDKRIMYEFRDVSTEDLILLAQGRKPKERT